MLHYLDFKTLPGRHPLHETYDIQNGEGAQTHLKSFVANVFFVAELRVGVAADQSFKLKAMGFIVSRSTRDQVVALNQQRQSDCSFYTVQHIQINVHNGLMTVVSTCKTNCMVVQMWPFDTGLLIMVFSGMI